MFSKTSVTKRQFALVIERAVYFPRETKTD